MDFCTEQIIAPAIKIIIILFNEFVAGGPLYTGGIIFDLNRSEIISWNGIIFIAAWYWYCRFNIERTDAISIYEEFNAAVLW